MRLPEDGSFSKVILALLGIPLLAFLLMAPGLTDQFVLWDDSYVVYNNPFVKEISWQTIKAAFSSYDPELYVPLTVLSYQIDHQIGNNAAIVYKMTNLLLHALNASLVFALCWLLSRRYWLAILCGVLFAVHPLSVEGVAWVSARKDVLSTFFFLLSTIAYLFSVRDVRRKLSYGLSLFFFLLGLLSKVMVLTLPFFLLLIDWYEGRIREKRVWIEKIPYIALSTIFGVVALYGKQETVRTLTFVETLLVSMKSAFFYLQKIFIPTDLTLLYPIEQPISITDPTVLLPALGLVVIIGLAIYSLRYTKLLAFAIAAYLLTLIPTLFNLQKGEVYFASDRYGYIPSITIFFAITLGIAMLIERFGASRDQRRLLRQVSTSVAIVFVLACMYLTHVQLTFWRNSETLFTRTLDIYPRAIAAHINLGMYYKERAALIGTDEKSALLDKATAEFETANDIKPHVLSYTNLASIASDNGNYELAWQHINTAMEIDPDDYNPHFGRAILLEKQGNYDEALDAYRTVIAKNPTNASAYNNSAAIYLDQRDYEEAKRMYEHALSIDPYIPDVHYNLGLIGIELNDTDYAIANFQQSLDYNPEDPDALVELATLYLSKQNIGQAVTLLKAALTIDPNHQDAIFLAQSMRRHGLINF